MSKLFTPLKLRGLTFKNRVLVSPMCQYSAPDGVPTDWHLVHLGSRAVGGAAAVFVEATAVSALGRISPFDTGLYNQAQQDSFARIATFLKGAGAIAAIQLCHAGRKASTDAPWRGGKSLTLEQGAWQPVGPSSLLFDNARPVPQELSRTEIQAVSVDFVASAQRARAAGFQVVEVHAAHGYLLHQFLSPLSNERTDDYGGSLENRMRLTLEVCTAVRAVWPEEWPVFVRLSATDWADNGWDLPQSIELARRLRAAGIDLIDCSSGGLLPHVRIPLRPGYQVPFSEAIRREAGIPTGAVGLITEPQQAEDILNREQADVVLLARAMLNDPYWPAHAAETLGTDVHWPDQYLRARPARS